MPQINPTIPRVGVDTNAVADPELVTALNTIVQTVNALDADNLIDSAVTALKLAADAVEAVKIKNNAVETAKIKDGAVTRPKLAATIKAERFTGTAIVTTTGTVYSTQTFTWAAAFADANYTVTASILHNDSGSGLRLERIVSKSASQVVVEISSSQDFQTYTPEVHLIAFHD